MNYTVTPNPTAWFTYNYSFLTTGGTCSSNACHGGTAPKWGTGTWDCVSCHNSSFAKKLGIGTIRQVVGTGGDFNMSAAPTGSRHLYGATTIVKWDCIVCHREGSLTTGKASATYHNDGIATTGGLIHLRNVDTINEAVGWAIDNKRWNTTDFKNLDDFCLSCHDADGSSQVAVNSTNNGLFTGTAAWNTTRAGWNTWGGTYPGRAAMSPFNSTDWASGWNNASTWSTTSGNRASMINIKGMFNPGTQVGYLYDGSPSQHAVLGQRYSTIWTSWVAAAWSSYTTKKTRTNLNSTREVSVLSCADCHVLDSGSGAHGGVRKYNLWHSTNQEICTVCHARATYGGGTNGQGLGSRYTHYYRRTPYTAYGLDSTPATWGTIAPCMVCHAGWDGITTISRQQSYGGIHGSWSSFIGWNTVRSTAWATMSPYRFFPGTYRRSLMANGDGQYNSTTAPSCYFVVAGGNPDAFTSCSSHAAGGSVANPTPLYGRPVKY
jgi:hypothetical protein